MNLETFLQEWNNAEDRLLVHTSGSTGKPKPMWAEKAKMLNSAHITCDFLGLRPGDTALLCLPLDYIAGKMMVVRSIERKLHLIAVKPDGHPLADSSLPPLDFAAMVPMQVFNSMAVPEERERLRSIKHLIIGGGAIDKDLEAQLHDFPHHVWSTYGMTETLSHIALRPVNGTAASQWYQPFDSVKVSTNADGCLVIDAPLVCSQRLVTNDIAELQVDGNGATRFRIKGRKDNVICCGGIKIQIEEVEDLLRPCLDAPFMIVRKEDRKFGETAVLLTESTDLAKTENICRSTLPKYWTPKEYIHVEHLPLTDTGKPRRGYFSEK